MKNENINIDKLFEDSLGNLRVEPSDASWDKIVAGVEAAQGKSGKMLWRWLAVAAASIAVIIYFVFFRSCSTNSSAQNYTLSDRINIVKSQIYVIKPKVVSIERNTLNIQNNISVAARKKKISKRINSSILNKNQITVDNNEKITFTGENNFNESVKTNNSSSNEDITANSVKSSEHKKNEALTKVEVATGTHLNNEEKEEIEIALENKTTGTTENDEINKIEESTAVPPGPQITTGLEIELGIGPSWVNSNIQQNPVYDNPLIEGINDNKLTTGEVFLQLKYSVSNFYAKTGFRFSEFGENASFTLSTEKHDTSGGYASWIMNRYWTYDTIGYFDDPNNPGMIYPILSPTYHIDTVGSQWNSKDRLYYDKTNINARNRYRYVQIPLIIGYQHNISRFGIYADGGVGIGFMVNTTGKFVENNELKSMNFTDNPYNKYNFNYMFNFGVNYYLSNRWNVFAEFAYKSNITSIYKSEFAPDVRYSATGINFGISYIIK